MANALFQQAPTQRCWSGISLASAGPNNDAPGWFAPHGSGGGVVVHRLTWPNRPSSTHVRSCVALHRAWVTAIDMTATGVGAVFQPQHRGPAYRSKSPFQPANALTRQYSVG